MSRARNFLKTVACIKLLEEFRNIRSSGAEIFNNLNRLIDEYLKSHNNVNPLFLDLIEAECQEAVMAREMTQDEMHKLLDKIGMAA